MYLLDLAPWPRPKPNPDPKPLPPIEDFQSFIETPEILVIFGALILMGAAAFLIYKTCKK